MKPIPAEHFAAAVGAGTAGHNAGAGDGDGLRFRGWKLWMTQKSRRTRAASRRWTTCSLENAEIRCHWFSSYLFYYRVFYPDLNRFYSFVLIDSASRPENWI